MKLSLERKIFLGFAAALVVLLLVTATAWWNVARFRSTHYWVNHNREVLTQIEQTRGNLLGMLASGRGFILTGSEEVLEPFNRGSTRLTQSMDELGRLVAEDPGQKERFARLTVLVTRAREIMLGQIETRRRLGQDAAAETGAYLAGQRAVTELGEGLREMAAAERQQLDDHLERVNRFGRLTIFALVGTSSLATGFVIMAARIVRSDLRRRQEVERTLRESNNRLEDLYNRAPCGYHSLDDTGTIIAINDTALQWLGLQRPAVVGQMKFVDLLAPESRAAFETSFRAFKRAGSVTDVEYIWKRADGTQFPVLLNATAIYDAAGKYVASRATVFNLTERKRAEAERDRFFIVSRDLLCIGGADGYFRRVNPAWEQTLGHSRDELLARPFIEFIHPEDIERTTAEFERLAKGHETIAFEHRFRCKDGSYRWLRWNARPALAENLIYASAHDVTEQRASAERIQWLNADLANRASQLEAANRELESFSYSVSHDLRAPLRHIDGFASLLTKRANAVLDTEARRYVATISKAAKQMGALIDDLLAFSRIGRVPLCLNTIRHEQLVADVIANGRYEPDKPTIAWHVGPLPEVHGDAAMLRQVWANLIDNAVKYSSKVASPVITIGARDEANGGEHVFFVRDNGVGFDMAYAEKLFGVFQRLHSSTEFDGTGIGLANVRRIVIRHGGRVWAESRLNEGATFYFSLPRAVSSSGVSS